MIEHSENDEPVPVLRKTEQTYFIESASLGDGLGCLNAKIPIDFVNSNPDDFLDIATDAVWTASDCSLQFVLANDNFADAVGTAFCVPINEVCDIFIQDGFSVYEVVMIQIDSSLAEETVSSPNATRSSANKILSIQDIEITVTAIGNTCQNAKIAVPFNNIDNKYEFDAAVAVYEHSGCSKHFVLDQSGRYNGAGVAFCVPENQFCLPVANNAYDVYEIEFVVSSDARSGTTYGCQYTEPTPGSLLQSKGISCSYAFLMSPSLTCTTDLMTMKPDLIKESTLVWEWCPCFCANSVPAGWDQATGTIRHPTATPTTTQEPIQPPTLSVKPSMAPFTTQEPTMFMVDEGTDCMCTQQYVPVCGMNGVTYSNPCRAQCDNVAVDYRGDCKKCEDVSAVAMQNEHGDLQFATCTEANLYFTETFGYCPQKVKEDCPKSCGECKEGTVIARPKCRDVQVIYQPTSVENNMKTCAEIVHQWNTTHSNSVCSEYLSALCPLSCGLCEQDEIDVVDSTSTAACNETYIDLINGPTSCEAAILREGNCSEPLRSICAMCTQCNNHSHDKVRQPRKSQKSDVQTPEQHVPAIYAILFSCGVLCLTVAFCIILRNNCNERSEEKNKITTLLKYQEILKENPVNTNYDLLMDDLQTNTYSSYRKHDRLRYFE